MTEERLEEIKESIEFQKNITMIRDYDRTFINEEIELYNEVVRLRKIIDTGNLFIETYLNNVDDIDANMEVVKDILEQHSLTLEQTTGIAND